MPEQIQNILNRISEWWKKFTTRQKALIISIAAVVVAAIAILVFVVSRPEKYTLITAKNAEEASQVKALLEGENISYEQSQDGMTFTIDRNDEANASILLGTNDIPSNGYKLSDVFDGGFSTTEADKEKKYQLYLQDRYEAQLATINNVVKADVNLNIPNDDGTILSMRQDSFASVKLTLSGELEEGAASGIANFLATTLGNENTDNILIMDSAGNVLFSGGDSASITGLTSSQLSLQQKLENMVKADIKNIVIGTSVYDNCAVGLNLDVNWSEKTVTDHHYYVDEGQTQGYLDSRSEYTSTSTSGNGGTPGTASNDNDTTYVLEDNNTTESEVSDIQEYYLPSETVTVDNGAVGTINYDTSSVTVVMNNYVMYNEDALRNQGLLDDISFEEYIRDISITKAEVDNEFYAAIANATGFSTDSITIMAYDVPFFEYSEGSGRTVTDYLQIALAVLILLMLGFVVFRSLRRDKPEEEPEPELSVEDLLTTTKENQDELESIGYSEKSEARLLIEKFVDEKPEAVASLLRNWLNEDWG